MLLLLLLEGVGCFPLFEHSWLLLTITRMVEQRDSVLEVVLEMVEVNTIDRYPMAVMGVVMGVGL